MMSGAFLRLPLRRTNLSHLVGLSFIRTARRLPWALTTKGDSLEAAREYEQDIEGDLWHISYSVEGASQSAAEQPGIEKTGEFITSLSTGFVDSSIPDRGDLRPELVYNNSREGARFLRAFLTSSAILRPATSSGLSLRS